MKGVRGGVERRRWMAGIETEGPWAERHAGRESPQGTARAAPTRSRGDRREMTERALYGSPTAAALSPTSVAGNGTATSRTSETFAHDAWYSSSDAVRLNPSQCSRARSVEDGPAAAAA